jgi:hypothetical protein
MATAKHRAIDLLRRNKLVQRKHEELAHKLDCEREATVADLDAALDDDIGDDLLRLVFMACNPVLSTEARVALTLRLHGLVAHRASLRRVGPARPIPARGIEPRGGRRVGVRSPGRPRPRRCIAVGAVTGGLPPVAERARRLPLQAWPVRRGPSGIRARGSVNAQRTGARDAYEARPSVRWRQVPDAATLTKAASAPVDREVNGFCLEALASRRIRRLPDR